jgi:hypothetical protein
MSFLARTVLRRATRCLRKPIFSGCAKRAYVYSSHEWTNKVMEDDKLKFDDRVAKVVDWFTNAQPAELDVIRKYHSEKQKEDIRKEFLRRLTEIFNKTVDEVFKTHEQKGGLFFNIHPVNNILLISGMKRDIFNGLVLKCKAINKYAEWINHVESHH